MKISTICALGSLLVTLGAYANGVVPVLDLDFTRSATEILKKRGIDDACIVNAATPQAFTYCREGSPTLWKYQAVDLDQHVTPQKGEAFSATDFGRITVAEPNSASCLQDTPNPMVKPDIVRSLVFGLIALFLLIGLRHTFRAITHRHNSHTTVPAVRLQRVTVSLPAHHSAAKALRAFGVAAAVAFIYLAYLGF